MRTNDLRKLIQSRLLTLKTSFGLKNVSYKTADDKKMYPHITYSISYVGALFGDRYDVTLYIDIWTKGDSYAKAEDMADAVEDLLQNQNLPQETILPTFFLESREEILDEDKTIQHIELKFTVQNYER